MRQGIFCANLGRTSKPLRILLRIIIPKNADYVKDFSRMFRTIARMLPLALYSRYFIF